MFLELNSNDADQIATGLLIREGIKQPFNYSTLPNSRKITKHNPMQGYFTVKATITVKTNNDLNFVIGDEIKLEGFNTPFRVGNLDLEIEEKQLMFLNEPSKSYILDLE